ncbi:hypothetical protein SAMD00019534_091270 [Acytostelium subglobosum LB1]|uniref:hypothetical protein n=1 Tax=Acytostelium subglobosum LB1 TaxID=1410327 RepID=UPI0006449210|nr:hypothetical protein SAMD00019534_091270 [Acytostelium subglobosum LB1]GAM25952.1 hypothetical protein SAMD00019534_091270 [Acytostelium subglobosum LB1]|eukprot:XP_012750995.1 hypothetical protein SAMD00019534_091270 [Acytostelium subglobosum LB1]
MTLMKALSNLHISNASAKTMSSTSSTSGIMSTQTSSNTANLLFLHSVNDLQGIIEGRIEATVNL